MELADDVTHYLLSFLPLKVVVAATLACKQWQARVDLSLLWASLDLSVYASQINDDVLGQILARYHRPSALKKLNLDYCIFITPRSLSHIYTRFAESLQWLSCRTLTIPHTTNEYYLKFLEEMQSLKFFRMVLYDKDRRDFPRPTYRLPLNPSLARSLEDCMLFPNQAMQLADFAAALPNFKGVRCLEHCLATSPEWDSVDIFDVQKKLLAIDPNNMKALQFGLSHARVGSESEPYARRILQVSPYNARALKALEEKADREALKEANRRLYLHTVQKLRRLPFLIRTQERLEDMIVETYTALLRAGNFESVLACVQQGIEDLSVSQVIRVGEDYDHREDKGVAVAGREEVLDTTDSSDSTFMFQSSSYQTALNHLQGVMGTILFSMKRFDEAYLHLASLTHSLHHFGHYQLLYLMTQWMPENLIDAPVWEAKIHKGEHWNQLHECIRNTKCTLTVFGAHPVAQYWFQCVDCNLIGFRGICASCAITDHADHKVFYKYFSRGAYCDCALNHS